MRLSGALLVVVAAAAESVDVCDCSPRITAEKTRLTSLCDGEKQTLRGQLTQAEQTLASTQQTLASTQQNLNTARASVTALESKVKDTATTCQTDLTAAQTKLREMKESVSQTDAKLKTELYASQRLAESLNDQLASCSAKSSTLQSEYTQVLAAKKSETQRLLTEKQKLNEELDAVTGKIYSSAQFMLSARHSQRLGSAFINLMRDRFVNAVGREVLEVAALQSRLWYNTGKQFAAPYMAKVSSTAANLDEQYAISDKMMSAFNKVADASREPIMNFGSSALEFTEKRMDRFVNNLSQVDPEIRSLFPTEFKDRCYAFAFVFGLAYVVMGVVQWVLGCVWAVVSSPFRRNVKSKKAKKMLKAKKSHDDDIAQPIKDTDNKSTGTETATTRRR